MYKESPKIHLIEEVLKVDDAATLNEIETLLKKSKKVKAHKKSIYDFVGVLSDIEAGKMKKAITESCEIINDDDWK